MSASLPVVFVIGCDPRQTHRAFEAMRIGVGVLAGETEVRFVLLDGAVHLLDGDTEELVDGDEIAKFRGNLRAMGVTFHVEAGAVPDDPDWNADDHTVARVSADEVAGMVAASRRVLVF